MRLLKENDIEAYTKLVQQTKNERLQELLRATEEFLESLGRKVQIQKMETDRLQAQSQLYVHPTITVSFSGLRCLPV